MSAEKRQFFPLQILKTLDSVNVNLSEAGQSTLVSDANRSLEGM